MTAAPASARAAAAFDRYSVEHETRYAYRVPVVAVVAARAPDAAPAAVAARRLARAARSSRAPDERHETRDAFGNGVTHFGVHGPHPLLRVRMLLRGRDLATGPIRPRGRRWPGRRCANAVSTSPRRTTCARCAWPSRARSCPGPMPRGPMRRRASPPGATGSSAVHRADAPDPRRVRVRRRGDDGDDVGRRGARAAQAASARISPTSCSPACAATACRRAMSPATCCTIRRPGGRACSAPTRRTPGSPPIRRTHGWVEFDPTNDTLADRRYITLADRRRLRRRRAAARRHPRRPRADDEGRGERHPALASAPPARGAPRGAARAPRPIAGWCGVGAPGDWRIATGGPP